MNPRRTTRVHCCPSDRGASRLYYAPFSGGFRPTAGRTDMAIRWVSFLALVPILACSNSGSERSSIAEHDSATATQPRAIVLAFRYEKNDLSTKTLTQAGQEYRV